MLAELQGRVTFTPRALLNEEQANLIEMWPTADLAAAAEVPVTYVRKAIKGLGDHFTYHAQQTRYACYTRKGRLMRRPAWLIPVWLRHTIIIEAKAMYPLRRRRSSKVRRVA